MLPNIPTLAVHKGVNQLIYVTSALRWAAGAGEIKIYVGENGIRF